MVKINEAIRIVSPKARAGSCINTIPAQNKIKTNTILMAIEPKTIWLKLSQLLRIAFLITNTEAIMLAAQIITAENIAMNTFASNCNWFQ